MPAPKILALLKEADQDITMFENQIKFLAVALRKQLVLDRSKLKEDDMDMYSELLEDSARMQKLSLDLKSLKESVKDKIKALHNEE